MGLLLHLLALSPRSNHQDGTDILIYDLWQLLPLVLILGLLGGLLGGALRLGVARYFSAPAELGRATREFAPASFVARLWAIVWRLAVAGAVGALPTIGPGFSIWYSLNRQAAPLIISSPFGFAWLTPLFPWLLIAGGMLIGQEARQNGSALARVGAGLLAALLLVGTPDLFMTLYLTATFHMPNLNFGSLLTRFASNSLLVVLPRALLTALALGGGPFSSRKARLALLAALGIAVFLGSLPQTLQELQTVRVEGNFQPGYWEAMFPPFLIAYLSIGIVGAGLCGLLGGRLRGKVLAAAVRLSRQPPAPAANVG